MNSSDLLNRAKSFCSRLVEQIFPEESSYFEDVWSVLLPLFEKWRRTKVVVRRYTAEDLLETAGLGFADARDWSMPIGLMTAVATMLEVWSQRRGDITESIVRGTLRKYAERFGAPRRLQELLEETALPFCMGFCEGMKWGNAHEREGAERRRQIELAMPEKDAVGDYVLLANEVPERSLTLQQLVEFKQQHIPKDFFIWIDESEGAVFVDNESLRLEKHPRLRRVLRYLVELRGQCITHKQLVKMCGKPGWPYYTLPDKLSRGWVIELWKAGTKKQKQKSKKKGKGKAKLKGRLWGLINSKPGGFAYEGPASFCIIKPAKDFE